MPVEEGPRRHDDGEGQGGPSETDIDGELDVLEEVSDQERKGLALSVDCALVSIAHKEIARQ